MGVAHNQTGETNRRFWSMFPLTRVPFWHRFLEPREYLGKAREQGSDLFFQCAVFVLFCQAGEPGSIFWTGWVCFAGGSLAGLALCWLPLLWGSVCTVKTMVWFIWVWVKIKTPEQVSIVGTYF